MLHACIERFDVMCVRGNILGWEGEVNAAYILRSFVFHMNSYHTPVFPLCIQFSIPMILKGAFISSY
jgi:hypothetical protein